MKISIPWTKTDQTDTHGAPPVGPTHTAIEWDHTAQVNLHEAEETLNELRDMWRLQKSLREQRIGSDDS